MNAVNTPRYLSRPGAPSFLVPVFPHVSLLLTGGACPSLALFGNWLLGSSTTHVHCNGNLRGVYIQSTLDGPLPMRRHMSQLPSRGEIYCYHLRSPFALDSGKLASGIPTMKEASIELPIGGGMLLGASPSCLFLFFSYSTAKKTNAV